MAALHIQEPLTGLCAGPVAAEREARVELAFSVARRLEGRYGPQLLFCALYGSVARQTDGPFSDIELFCAVDGEAHPCQVYEWLEGGIKVKIRVYSWAGLEAETSAVDPEWPLSHNKIFYHRLLLGEPSHLERLARIALAADDSAFTRAITRLYLAEVFELTAKLYNLCDGPVPHECGIGPVLVKLLEQVALILGLAGRACYSTRQRLLPEAVQRNLLTGAFPGLCSIALTGQWEDTGRLRQLTGELWQELSAFLVQGRLLNAAAINPF